MSSIAARQASLHQHLRIIRALMIREAMSKHGHHLLGFFWVIGEPLFLMMGIVLLWSFAHLTHGSDVAVIPFAVSSYSYLTLWRHIAGGSMRFIKRNRSLMYHRQVWILDAFVAMAALETLSLFATFLVVYIPTWCLKLSPTLYDPLLLVGGFFFTGWFAFAFGMLIAAASELSELIKNIIGPIMYITLPITGAFTFQAWLPNHLREIVAWSPLVNCVEMIRGGLFSPDVVTPYFSLSYLFVCCAATSMIGILFFSYAEKRSED